MPTILKLKRYAAGAALLIATGAGLTGCYVAPAYGPRPYAYAAPGYGAYQQGYYAGPAYGYGYNYNRGGRW